LIFEALNDNHIDQAGALAFGKYNAEKNKVSALPEFENCDFICEMISKMNTHNLGVAAIENGKVIGFITCYTPIKDYFGSSVGVFSPIHAHGTTKENSSKIYSLLYQKVADIWVKQGILSHAITLYAHDDQAIQSFFYNGFGLRCVDAISRLKKLPFSHNDGYKYEECTSDDYKTIAQMENQLIHHLRSSPMFMPRNPNKTAQSTASSNKEKGSRFFVARYKEKTIGFSEISDAGENFVCDAKDMKNICGAYLMPEHRSNGIFTNLLSYVSEVLIAEGYKHLDVDYESFNPTANAFWAKYFTHSLILCQEELMKELS